MQWQYAQGVALPDYHRIESVAEGAIEAVALAVVPGENDMFPTESMYGIFRNSARHWLKRDNLSLVHSFWT
jgi:hypothetical protein